LQLRRIVHMASFSEFVLGQLEHLQDVGGMFPERKSFGDKVNAVDPRGDEGRQGVIAGNCNGVAGEHFSGLDSLQYAKCQGQIVLEKSLDRTSASMNSNFHMVHFLLSDTCVHSPCNAMDTLQVRQNSWPIFMRAALALET